MILMTVGCDAKDCNLFSFLLHSPCFGELQLHINNNIFDEYVHKDVR